MDKMLTAAQVAEALQVSLATVKRWQREGRLTPYKVGDRAVRFKAAEVAAMVEQSKRSE